MVKICEVRWVLPGESGVGPHAWSRRACLPLLVGVAVAPVMSTVAPVAAQNTGGKFTFKRAEVAWRQFRRDDLGFRIDMPGDPAIYVDPDPRPWVKETTVECAYDVVSFIVRIKDLGRTATTQEAERLLDYVGSNFQKLMGPARVSRFSMNGFPGREDRIEMSDGGFVNRSVVADNRMIDVHVGYSPETKPDAERFISSFALLVGAR